MLGILYYYKTTLIVYVFVYILPIMALIYAYKYRAALWRINYGMWIVGLFFGGMSLWSVGWLLFGDNYGVSRCWDGGFLVC
jgi:hypothetical protein